MALFNHSWISSDGTPITGRVPTQVITPNGTLITKGQRTEIKLAYHQFSTAVNASAFPNGYHSVHRKLADGTPIRMESNGGVQRVFVWPVGEDAAYSRATHGFLFLPATVEWVPVIKSPQPNQSPWFLPVTWFKAWIYFAPGYSAQTPPPKMFDDPAGDGTVKARHPLSDEGLIKLPGSCAWRGGKSFDDAVINWRGPPRKYMPFQDFVKWDEYVAVTEGNQWNDVIGGPTDVLHRVSDLIWVDGKAKSTEVPFIFAACLHRPQGAEKWRNVILRVFGTDAIGSTDFKVYDLTPPESTIETSTLDAIRNAKELVVQQVYTPAGLFPGGLYPPLGNWSFVWAPSFNKRGDKMAVCLRERHATNSGTPGAGDFVCEMNATTFETSNKQYSRTEASGSSTTTEAIQDDVESQPMYIYGVGEVRAWPVLALYNSSNISQVTTIYIGCDYLDDQFVTLQVENAYTGSGESSQAYVLPGGFAASGSSSGSRTIRLVYSARGVLASASTAYSQHADMGSAVTGAHTDTSYEVTADLSVDFVHAMTFTADYPTVSYGSPAGNIAITLQSDVWFRGHSTELSTRSHTVVKGAWPPSKFETPDNLGLSIGGSTTTEVAPLTYEVTGGQSNYYGYRALAIAKDGNSAYLGRAILRTSAIFDQTSNHSTQEFENENFFLAAQAKDGVTTLLAWPAPAWFEGEGPSPYNAHIGAVFI